MVRVQPSGPSAAASARPAPPGALRNVSVTLPVGCFGLLAVTSTEMSTLLPTRIGDGVVTDVMGANGQGLDCLFVAAGIHGATAQGPDGRVDAEKAGELLKAETTYARYTMLDLAW